MIICIVIIIDADCYGKLFLSGVPNLMKEEQKSMDLTISLHIENLAYFLD